MSHKLQSWTASWHGARQIIASSAKGTNWPGWRLKCCEVKWRKKGKRSCKKLRTRRSWIGRSVICELEKHEGRGSNASKSAHGCCCNPTILEQLSHHSFRVDSAGFLAQHQPAPATPVHQVPGGQSGKEQPATKRVENVAFRRQGSQPRFSGETPQQQRQGLDQRGETGFCEWEEWHVGEELRRSGSQSSINVAKRPF